MLVVAVYRGAAHKLVTGAYLKPSTALSHVSPKDKQIKYGGEEKAKISGFPTARELREAKLAAEARLKQEEDEAEKIGLVSIITCGYVPPWWENLGHGRNAKLSTNLFIEAGSENWKKRMMLLLT